MTAYLPPAPAAPLQVLRLLGTNPTNGELEEIIRGIDLNQDGFIDFLEFARVWWVREQQNIEADFDIELELAFKVHHDLLNAPRAVSVDTTYRLAPRFTLRLPPPPPLPSPAAAPLRPHTACPRPNSEGRPNVEGVLSL
jgi:hypothetical protein